MQTALQPAIRLVLSIAPLMSIVSCTTAMSIRVEDLGDVSRFHTWDWLRDGDERAGAPVDPGSRFDRHVARQIEESLSARGFRRAPGSAEVLVDFDLRIRQETVEVARNGALRTLNSLHSSPSFEVQATYYEIHHYEVAELKIVAIDPRERSVVWRGAFVKRYAVARPPQLSDAVVQLLAKLPTARSRLIELRAIVREAPTDPEPHS
jgi:hypothetical protein